MNRNATNSARRNILFPADLDRFIFLWNVQRDLLRNIFLHTNIVNFDSGIFLCGNFNINMIRCINTVLLCEFTVSSNEPAGSGRITELVPDDLEILWPQRDYLKRIFQLRVPALYSAQSSFPLGTEFIYAVLTIGYRLKAGIIVMKFGAVSEHDGLHQFIIQVRIQK